MESEDVREYEWQVEVASDTRVECEEKRAEAFGKLQVG
jgi:hypothetical protein